MPDIFSDFAVDHEPVETPNDYSGLGTAAAVGVGLGFMGLLARKPGALKAAAGKLNAVRQQLMLSGLALPKSVLGNTGAVVAKSLEERSVNPLKQFFSMETLRDAKAAYTAGNAVGPVAGGVNLPGPNPGKLMGAMDTATQKALVRAGSTAEEAEASLFQTPLGKNFGKMGETLDSDAARYILPFRRTPFNQFSEGMKTLKPDFAHKGVRNAYAAAGAVHGAATSDEQFPASVPLATAASARYGVPYAIGAVAGRALNGGKGSAGMVGSMLPVSEYGVEQSITDPFAAFEDPAFIRTYGE